MFGYLQIEKEELLVKEFETYKAIYCGLCKQMGKDYSFLTRLTLSYDCTFYAMLLMSLHSSCGGFKKGRCTCNPLKSCNFACSNSDDFSKASAFSIITVYYKLIDDINDSGFFKSFFSRLIKPFFSHQRKKAKKLYPWIDEYVAEMMDKQAIIEQDSNSSVDISECTGTHRPWSVHDDSARHGRSGSGFHDYVRWPSEILLFRKRSKLLHHPVP